MLKTKNVLNEGPDNIIAVLGLCFLLINWLSFGKGIRLKLDFKCQGGGRSSDVDGQGRVGDLNIQGCHISIIPKHNALHFLLEL